MRLSRLARLGSLAMVAACAGEASGPPAPLVSISVQAGASQFGTINATLAEPLQVIVLDPSSKRPVENAVIEWRVVSGLGGSVSGDTKTGSNGIARATARLGPALGDYVFEATSTSVSGSPARFPARAVQQPTIASVVPRTADAGATITINGTNFSPSPSDNAVLFSGLRARVLTATSTRLSVVVPVCVPSRNATVVVRLGAVASAPDSITVLGVAGSPLQLQPGQARLFRDSLEFPCQRVVPTAAALYLVISQNVSESIGSQTPFELTGLTGTTFAAAVHSSGFPVQQKLDYGAEWELRLRAREREFRGVSAEPMPVALRIRPPDLGDRQQFKVFDKNDRFVNVTAEVKAISQRAIIFQDLNAPANGFTTAQFQQLGNSFDSPAYDVDVSVFGEPSDIDSNGKTVILLTPVVNELTPRGSNGFVAGFFYGCDLQNALACSGTNAAEMFYLFVPDPTGQFGDARTTQFVLNAALPVLAHEFMHMISFGARKSLDALWLAEGLAHHAEDLVADEFRRRGDNQNAALFSAQNYARASFYLRDTTTVSLISEELPGSLALRGGAWLLVKYVAGQYGGNTVLRTLARSTLNGAQNMSSATGQSWSTLLSDWAVALWADDAPELSGVQVSARHSFNNINLRTAVTTGGSYPLRPTQLGFADFALGGVLSASSQRMILLSGGLPPRPLNLAFTGQHGGPFTTGAVPQITFLRVR